MGLERNLVLENFSGIPKNDDPSQLRLLKIIEKVSEALSSDL